MEDFVARQPILNGREQVCAYRLLLGRSLRSCFSGAEGAAGPDAASRPGTSGAEISAELVGRLSDGKPPHIDFFEELKGADNRHLTDAGTVVAFRKGQPAGWHLCALLKSKGYRLAYDSTFFAEGATETELADIMTVAFTSVSLSNQAELVRKYKNHVVLLAENIETRGDFNVARDMGYDLFQGYFFLWPTGSLLRKELRSLDVCLVDILRELEKPDPNFRSISDIIEHDLGLSYKLLRLINSAYMAPKYRIRSISQALTYLGIRELHQWISMLMFNGIRSEENSELVVMSLIRGKMAALVAQELQLALPGTEPFFTGLFSLIDVILNRPMNAVLAGLPLSDDVKMALTGSGNELSELLDFVVAYEQASWRGIEGNYPMNRLSQERMVAITLEAHQWAGLMDSPPATP